MEGGEERGEGVKSAKSAIAKILFFFLLLAVLPANIEAAGRKPRVFPIQMTVDFGPAGKPVHAETIYVEKGTTPKEAVSQVFPILSGKSCCSFREVLAIDGVEVDAMKKRWWICLVNGNKKDTSPHQTKLEPGDVVEWKYIEDE
jgi:hypothetical protein